jgi:hypothetical protein
MLTRDISSYEFFRTCFAYSNRRPMLLAVLLALLPLAPSGAQAEPEKAGPRGCTYRIGGTLEVDHKKKYKNFLGTKRSPLEGVKVRVQVRRLVAGGGVWATLGTDRTGGRGNFDVSDTKTDCSKREFKVQVRFQNPDLEIRHKTAVSWFTVYRTKSSVGSGVDKDKTLTFSSSGSLNLGDRKPWYHAEIWALYKAAINHMASYGSRLGFQNQVVVEYPHDHVAENGVSYADPIRHFIFLVKNPKAGPDGHDGGANPDVALHELMHIWAYQHSRHEDGVADYLANHRTTHGIVEETYVAFHEGFAEWASQVVGKRIGTQDTENPYGAQHLEKHKDYGIKRFNKVQYADHGWESIFNLMHQRRPWEFNFRQTKYRLSRKEIIPFKNCQVGRLDFTELINIIDRKGKPDIDTGFRRVGSAKGEMNWSAFTNQVVSRPNGVGRSDIKSYRKMLDPMSTRQEVLSSMCEKGEQHTVVIKGENISGKTDYTVKGARAIKQVSGTLEGYDVSENSSDQVNGTTATGKVSAGNDGFRVAGEIEEIRINNPSAATAYVDGKEYHTVVITSENASGKTTYTVNASGDLAQVGGSLDGHSVSVNSPDQVSGATASGRVKSGTDGFKVTGTIQEIRLDNPDAATVYVDDGGPLGGGAPLQVYASRRISVDGTADFGRAGTDVRFQGTSGSATVSVRKLGNGPSGTRGIPESSVSDYRFVIDAVGNLSFGTDPEVRFDVDALGGVGNAANVTAYRRSAEGSGAFSRLATSFDSGQSELVATTGSFGEFAFGSDTEPLPVEMASFDATLQGSGVRLHWQTASETNNSGFKVQRRPGQEGSWRTIGFVDSKASGGTTTGSKTYRFDDTELPYEATSLNYRLKQVDLDGTTQLTDVVTVERSVQSVALPAPFPNPAHSQATIRFKVRGRQDVRLRLYNVLGEKVRALVSGRREGRQEVQVDVSTLSSGTYFLRLSAGGQTRTRRLKVVR